MFRFAGRRLIQIAIVAVAIVFFTHLGMRMVGNSANLRRSANLVNDSGAAWAQTQDYLGDAILGDFGAIQTRRALIPVREILVQTYVNSMGLVAAALVVALAAGFILGTVAGLSRRSPWVLALLTLTVLGISTPSFFAALFLQMQTIKIQQLTNLRLAYVGGFGWDKHMVLPMIVLAARPLAYLTRTVHHQLEQVMTEDYVRTAYAKGLNLRQVINGHAWRNIAVPVLTTAGLALRFSLGSLPVVEYFFGWPGMGSRLIEAIQEQQTPVVVTLALAIGLTILLINLALDIAFRFIDPRLRSLDG